MFDGDTITIGGYEMKVKFVPDEDSGPPWENSDGHGKVTDWTTREKRPNERILSSDRSSHRFYDWQASVRLAIKDGWGVMGGKREGETNRQYAARAVEADYNYLKGWCNDEWRYVGVVVKYRDEQESLWGVEDSDSKYLEEVVQELGEELASRLDEAEALREFRERHVMGIEYGCTL